MKKFAMSDDKTVESLVCFLNIQYQELSFRRNREFHVFLWFATVLLAIDSSLLIIDNSKNILWMNYGVLGKITVSCIIFVIGALSITWQNRERKFSYTNCKIISMIEELLGGFEVFASINRPLFPEYWKKWGTKNLFSVKRYLRGNFVTTTCLLTIVSICVIWI